MNGSRGVGSSLLSPAALTIAPTNPTTPATSDSTETKRLTRLSRYVASTCVCWYPHRLNRRTPRTHSTNDLSADLVTAPSTDARVGSTAASTIFDLPDLIVDAVNDELNTFLAQAVFSSQSTFDSAKAPFIAQDLFPEALLIERLLEGVCAAATATFDVLEILQALLV